MQPGLIFLFLFQFRRWQELRGPGQVRPGVPVPHIRRVAAHGGQETRR